MLILNVSEISLDYLTCGKPQYKPDDIYIYM